MFLRGIPEDYEDWAERGNDRWGYWQLLPYLRRIETDEDFDGDFHGSDGPIIVNRNPPGTWPSEQKAWVDACRALGFPESPDINHPDSTGVGPTPFNTVDRVRWSTALGYLDSARDRPNLTIRPEFRANRVVFDGGRAVGVEGETSTGTLTEHGDEVILAAGAIGSPHLLLLSGVGPPAHLEEMDVPVNHDLPGVGLNLRDHPQVLVLFRNFRPPLGGPEPPLQPARLEIYGLRLRSAKRHADSPDWPGPHERPKYGVRWWLVRAAIRLRHDGLPVSGRKRRPTGPAQLRPRDPALHRLTTIWRPSLTSRG